MADKNTNIVQMTESGETKEKPVEPAQKGIILLVTNTDYSEYDLLRVRGMERSGLLNLLLAMKDDGRQNAEAYLEEAGAEITLLGNEQSEEVEEYHLDFAYNKDTHEITDFKTLQEEKDFNADMAGTEPHTAPELSAMMQAEQLINRMEYDRTVFEDDERNLIVNHAYKLDDMEKTTALALSIAEQKGNFPLLQETKSMAQAEIDFLPDGMVGLSQMHKYGYSWDEMLPLTTEKALELFKEDLAVHLLHTDGSRTLVEDEETLQKHDGLFGIEKDDWSAYLEFESMKREAEDGWLHGTAYQEQAEKNVEVTLTGEGQEVDNAALLAKGIDQLSYDYDTSQYNNMVEDRNAQVASIAEDIRNGNTGYLDSFLNAVISESIREGINDIFGKGLAFDDSESVQTARKARELLDKMAEYKPLAKVEELAEQNCNMIDNILNNEKPEAGQGHRTGKTSVKEKLAEKKAIVGQMGKTERKTPEKRMEKKAGREV